MGPRFFFWSSDCFPVRTQIFFSVSQLQYIYSATQILFSVSQLQYISSTTIFPDMRQNLAQTSHLSNNVTKMKVHPVDNPDQMSPATPPNDNSTPTCSTASRVLPKKLSFKDIDRFEGEEQCLNRCIRFSFRTPASFCAVSPKVLHARSNCYLWTLITLCMACCVLLGVVCVVGLVYSMISQLFVGFTWHALPVLRSILNNAHSLANSVLF